MNLLTSLFLLGAALLATLASTTSTTIYEETDRITEALMEKMKGHQKHLRPPGTLTNVTVNLFVRNIFSMDETNRKWKVQLTFRQEWTDTRLAFTTSVEGMERLAYGNPKDIWTPDLFFRDEMSSEEHVLFHPNDLIYIYPEGRVLFSKRVTLELYCPVDFNQPTFVCPLSLASYMFTKDELMLHWKTEDPIQLPKMVYMPDYILNGVTTQTCDSKTVIGKFSCISALFNIGHKMCKA